MNDIIDSDNSSFNLTSTTISSSTISSIPYREQILIDAFNTYIQIGIGSLLFLFGLTFNCLSLLYFHVSRSFRHTTFRLYFSIIAILDTIRLFEFLIFLLFDKGYLKVTLTLCRSIFFTIMFTGQASIWLTIALAVEKCIIILFPIKGRLCFTMSISKGVLVFVLCLVFFADVIYLLPSFFLHTYENISIHTFMCVWQKGSQSPENTNDQWKKHYFTFNTVFFHSIIPSIILLILNWLILCSLSRQRVILTKIGSLDAKNVSKREKQFKEKTIQLVLSSFFVIITISPRYILTMVNAFAANISKTSIMPLYVYVNLNTVFRVLEMCNYSLNIIFAIMSGRTSRLEIRKLLWECLFWRFKRTQVDQNEMKYPANLFLFEEDEDTERSIQGPTSTSYSTSTAKLSHRHNYLTPKSSTGNYSLQPSTTSIFTCCGFTIDLSHKQAYTSYSRSTIDDFPTCRSLTNKKTISPLSRNLYPHSSIPSDNRIIRQQNTVCYRPTTIDRPITRRRATTVVYCSHKTPISAMTTLTNKLATASTTFNPSIQRFIPEENQSPPLEKLPSIIDLPSTTTKDGCQTNINLTEPPIIIQTEYDELLSPASIIETC